MGGNIYIYVYIYISSPGRGRRIGVDPLPAVGRYIYPHTLTYLHVRWVRTRPTRHTVDRRICHGRARRGHPPGPPRWRPYTPRPRPTNLHCELVNPHVTPPFLFFALLFFSPGWQSPAPPPPVSAVLGRQEYHTRPSSGLRLRLPKCSYAAAPGRQLATPRGSPKRPRRPPARPARAGGRGAAVPATRETAASSGGLRCPDRPGAGSPPRSAPCPGPPARHARAPKSTAHRARPPATAAVPPAGVRWARFAST